MSTVAPPLLLQLAKDWRLKCGLKSATFAGCVGDKAHAARGGYHQSREDQPATNYSVVRPDDLGGPSNMAAALDMAMSASDMRLCTSRLVAVFNNPDDPRRKYLNAFNGTTDSRNARRWDVYARKVKAATIDHLSHIHLEVRRKYVGSPTAMAAIFSALSGESVSAFLKRAGMSVVSSATSSTVSRVPAFPGVLKRNDKQPAAVPGVKQLQAQLIKRGVSSFGPADGFFGPRLESAVKAWQARCGLGPDGVVGPKTWPTPWTAK